MTQYLTFELEEEILALDISKGREVPELTKVLRPPQCACGVNNC